MRVALQHPLLYGTTIPAYFILLLLLSDNEGKVRDSASDVTSSVLNQYMISLPIPASEALAQAIGETFEPLEIEKLIIPFVSVINASVILNTGVKSSRVLFEKERSNVWRDGIHQFGLYTRILGACWSRRLSVETGFSLQDHLLVEWVMQGISATKSIIQMNDDIPLGWSCDTDAFEVVMQILMLAETILKYGHLEEMVKALTDLRFIMVHKGSHQIWIEKIGEILGARD